MHTIEEKSSFIFARCTLNVNRTLLYMHVCMCARLHPTLGDPMACDQPGSSVHGILQASMLECVAMSSSRGSSRPRG